MVPITNPKIPQQVVEELVGACPKAALEVDGVPRLPPAQGAAWVGFLAAHSALMRALDADLAAEFGLSVSALEVLSRVADEAEGQLRMSDLAQGALLSPSRVSRIVDQLELRGLLERGSCPSDSRGVFAIITPAGRELAERALESHWAKVEERFFARLDEDQIAALGAIWAAILAP